MNAYEKVRALGEGQFGVVKLYRHKDTGEEFAGKKIKLRLHGSDGINFSAIREMKALQETEHPNVVALRRVVHHKTTLILLYEYCWTDLEAVIKDKSLAIPEGAVKGFMLQIMTGLSYLHRSYLLHRDIKPSNVLVDAKGVVKLTDFGLSRPYGSPQRLLSPQVVTQWYKAPELLYGARHYGEGIDLWALGCVFAELMLRAPYLPGTSDIDQLGKIFAALGTPTEADWPDMHTLPSYVEFQFCPRPALRNLFRSASPEALDLLQGLMRFDPKKRIRARDALQHAYLGSASPAPAPPDQLPLPAPRKKKAAERRPTGGTKRKLPRLDFGEAVGGEASTKRRRTVSQSADK
mmetsp:Transcript_10617/g.29765  ORF Transcript_10617/g.29765 Transcript_10617/m.29765 type:complete len:349 (+) Transcript_10617:94-1140(+)